MSKVQEEAIAPAIRREIDARLIAIEEAYDVRLLLAVESGSRAWGFPSPDSDYDVRFIYVRRRDWYLSLTPGRDVIEAPIHDEIDLNGWDIRKSLGLLLKSNAVVSEWIGSPIRYRPDHAVVAALTALSDAALDPRALAHHYASLGRNAAERWLDAARWLAGDGRVPVKKYFYALRPALAVRCLRLNPYVRPPMSLQALIEASGLPKEICAEIDLLVEAKRRTNERSNTLRAPALDWLIGNELARAGEVPAITPDPRLRDRATALFLESVNT